MAQHNKKIQLKKRSRTSAQLHRGFSMPVGPGSENSLISFRNFKDLKAKYFRFKGRIARQPFIARTLVLMAAQFLFSAILYAKFIESLWLGMAWLALLFSVLFLVLSIPVVWAQLALGWRRCHDMNKSGPVFLIPFVCYMLSYVFTGIGLETEAMLVQSITAVTYLWLFTGKGTAGDNAYGTERAR